MDTKYCIKVISRDCLIYDEDIISFEINLVAVISIVLIIMIYETSNIRGTVSNEHCKVDYPDIPRITNSTYLL